MTPNEFFAEALPWAQKSHALCYVLVSVILAQWADETGYGGPDWSPNNNPGNVGSYDGKPVATFPTLEAGVDAYIQTMNLDYYTAVREAKTADTQAHALGESPWASGHYGNPPGSDLIAIINNYDLTKYDQQPHRQEEDMELYTTNSAGTGFVVAADLSTKRGIPDAADAQALLGTGLYKSVKLDDALINAIPDA